MMMSPVDCGWFEQDRDDDEGTAAADRSPQFFYGIVRSAPVVQLAVGEMPAPHAAFAALMRMRPLPPPPPAPPCRFALAFVPTVPLGSPALAPGPPLTS